MQQILIIHGGDSYQSRDEFLEYLKNKSYSLDRLRGSDWKSSLQTELGDAFDVLRASMPNKDNAVYSEWKLVMDNIAPLLSDEVILIGHSLGGLFLAKHLSEEPFPKKIKATILIAAPYSTKDHEPITDFLLPTSLEKLSKQSEKICLVHSSDDPVVPFSDMKFYKEKLPEATSIELRDKGHFNQNSFPELVEVIKKLV